MRIALLITGFVLITIGVVWVLQGMNSQIAPQSFMTGSKLWIGIGAATIAFGVLALVRSRSSGD